MYRLILDEVQRPDLENTIIMRFVARCLSPRILLPNIVLHIFSENLPIQGCRLQGYAEGL